MQIRNWTRWLGVGLATVAVAALAPSRPTHADTTYIPNLTGLVFKMNFNERHDTGDTLKVAFYNASNGKFTGWMTRNNVQTGVIGEVSQEFAGAAIKISFANYVTGGQELFEGSLRAGPVKKFYTPERGYYMAGTYIRKMSLGAIIGVLGPYPFCGSIVPQPLMVPGAGRDLPVVGPILAERRP